MITTECIITFPKLFKPEENLSGILKYSCSLLVDKTDKKGIAEFEKEIAKAIERGKEKTWNGKVPSFRYKALRDGDEELESGDKEGPEYKGRYFINATSNEDDPPGVVGPDALPLMDQSQIYSGCIVRADIKAFPYKHAGNSGVGWYLNNVMLVRDGERLDGKLNAVDAFANFAQEQDPHVGEDDLS